MTKQKASNTKTGRAQFATKTGVIAATVGSAVGLGNIWRFPYETGVHGGGAFLLIYVVCVLVVGIPVIISEFAIGRATHRNPKGAFAMLAPGSPFRAVPYVGIVASMMILSFYSVVAGWIMEYLWQSVSALFTGGDATQYADRFSGFITGSWRPAVWVVVFLGLNYAVLRRGVEKGIERVSNILMPVLFVILAAMCVNSLTLPGAHRGLEFMFQPDFSQITPSVVIGAMGQAFFSLSLGLTCLLTYASYFSDETRLAKSATITAVLDTLVALMAGAMIFPAVFTFGMEPQAGPTLVFVTLPEIFAQMPGGHVWSVLFFVLLFFASITSTISMSEISISYFCEEHHMSRAGATRVNTAVCMLGGVLCALSFGPLSHVTICGLTIFNLFDYVSSNICLPLGGMAIALFVGWRLDRTFLQSQLLRPGQKPGVGTALIRACIRYVAPAAIAVIFISGLIK